MQAIVYAPVNPIHDVREGDLTPAAQNRRVERRHMRKVPIEAAARNSQATRERIRLERGESEFRQGFEARVHPFRRSQSVVPHFHTLLY